MPRCNHAGFTPDSDLTLNSMLAPAPARFVAPSHVHEEPLPGDAIKMDEAISATSIILDSVE